MDFLDPKKKRAHTIRLYLGYALVAIAIGIGAFVLLYAAYGYGVDRSGNVFQNGLMFLASTPDGAETNISSTTNTFKQQATTSARLVLPADEYNVEMLKQGYRTWSRTVPLKGGQVERLVYPFLFPETLVTKDQQLYSTQPGLTTASPDRRWIVVQSPTEFNAFDVFDTSSPDAVAQRIAVPASLFAPTATSQQLQLVEWSTDNRHILVRYVHDNTTEFLMLDRESPQNSININQHMGVTASNIMLRDKSAEKLYMQLPDGQLINANTKDKTTSPLLSNVVTFWPHGDDTIAYISNKDLANTGVVSVQILSAGTSYQLRTLPNSPSYLIDLAQYNGHWYVAAGATNDQHVYVYRDPVETLQRNDPESVLTTRTLRISNPQKLSFSNNAQFIAVQSGQQFVVYDAEADRQYRYEIPDAFEPGALASWMDGHRLTSVSGGKVIVFDFDGSNKQLLNAIVANGKPMFDRDYTLLYAVAPSVDVSGRFALTRTDLRVKN